MNKNKKAVNNLNNLITAYRTDDITLFKENLPYFKKDMEQKLSKKLTDQDCVLLVRQIVNLLPTNNLEKENVKNQQELEMI